MDNQNHHTKTTEGIINKNTRCRCDGNIQIEQAHPLIWRCLQCGGTYRNGQWWSRRQWEAERIRRLQRH